MIGEIEGCPILSQTQICTFHRCCIVPSHKFRICHIEIPMQQSRKKYSKKSFYYRISFVKSISDNWKGIFEIFNLIVKDMRIHLNYKLPWFLIDMRKFKVIKPIKLFAWYCCLWCWWPPLFTSWRLSVHESNQWIIWLGDQSYHPSSRYTY